MNVIRRKLKIFIAVCVAFTSQTLASASDQRLFLIEFKDAPVLRYGGGLPGYAATAPSVSGREFKLANPAVEVYLAYLTRRQAEYLLQISKLINRETKPIAEYQLSTFSIAMELSFKEANQVRKLTGVVRVAPVAARALHNKESVLTTP